ncbi:hypothetical protein CPC08DRAFT_712439 [Agrocybe pediades]|nr:hypothetical protein CPC08DRAFT_712439 [Agrocybe pediades]
MSFLARRSPVRRVSRTWTNQCRSIAQSHTPNRLLQVNDKPREVDLEYHDVVKNTLLHVLRSEAGQDHGLPTKPDGSLSVKALLNYPMFRGMSIVALQKIIKEDPKYQFILSYDPTKTEDAWWIRAKLWDEKHYVPRPVRLISNVTNVHVGVYKTTLDAWNNDISRNGISRQDEDSIRLEPTIANNDYVNEPNDKETEVFVFVDIRRSIYAGLRFFHRVATSDLRGYKAKRPIYTSGNELGLIPPHLFIRAHLIESKRAHVWGSPKPAPDVCWPSEEQDYDHHGRRNTMLPLLPYRLHGFVDLIHADKPNGLNVHPETIKEAEEVCKL